MKTKGLLSFLGTGLALLLIPFGNLTAQEKETFSYEGVATCGMCHKSEKQGAQLKTWQDSLHAQAYKVLQTEEAKQIAQKQGLKTDPEKEEACLRCHATGYNVDKSLLGKKFSIEDGVQCETCHGPGSGYKSIKVMRDQKAAIEKGLIVHGEKTEEFCVTCHNPESPTYASFDFKTMWAKIEHPVPK